MLKLSVKLTQTGTFLFRTLWGFSLLEPFHIKHMYLIYSQHTHIECSSFKVYFGGN